MNPRFLSSLLLDASERAMNESKQTLSNAFYLVANTVAKKHYDITQTLKAAREDQRIAAQDRAQIVDWLKQRA